MRTRLTARAGSRSMTMPEMTPGLYFLAIEGAPARKIIVTP
jgi:hypothetical protein